MKYTINKGRHYCTAIFQRFIPLLGTPYQRTAIIPSRNWYPHSLVKHSGKNKLCGRTYGCINPHKNSMRVAWQPDFEQQDHFKLYYYWYNDSKRESFYACTIKGDTPIRISITQKDSSVEIIINEHHKVVNFHQPLKKWGFKLLPYFGGRDKAYFKMSVNIKKG